jgi:hypothetical protein
MSRYIGQWDDVSCGPIAIHNALVWAGMRLKKGESLPFLTRVCKCTIGTTSSQLIKIAKKMGRISKAYTCIEITRNLSIIDVERHLNEGGAVIGQYAYKQRSTDEWSGHCYFIDSIISSGKAFKTVNYFSKTKPIQYINRTQFMFDACNTIFYLLLHKNNREVAAKL